MTGTLRDLSQILFNDDGTQMTLTDGVNSRVFSGGGGGGIDLWAANRAYVVGDVFFTNLDSTLFPAGAQDTIYRVNTCLLYTSPSPRDS